MLSADGNCELFSLKVLMVEDEEKIPAFVRKGREARGFDTSVVENDDDSYALAHGGTLELLDTSAGQITFRLALPKTTA